MAISSHCTPALAVHTVKGKALIIAMPHLIAIAKCVIKILTAKVGVGIIPRYLLYSSST